MNAAQRARHARERRSSGQGRRTLAPARALGEEGRLGCIAPGALADLIAIPVSGRPEEAAAACVAHTGRVPWMLLDGNPVDFTSH